MNVKLNWLNELVDLKEYSTKELVDRLSLYSTEIECVKRVLSGSKLVVGHVLTCINHPDSDHLHITTVDCGSEVLQIVCGAPNIKEGMYVIVALIDCVLPGDFKIKKSKIRGVESFGMICSLEELGMEHKFVPEKYLDGIYYFEKEVTPGMDALKALDFDDDILELSITPNRGDLMSMMGVAYEVSAVFNKPINPLKFKKIEEGYQNKDLINVKIATDKCYTYYAKVIKDVKLNESPDWLKSRLIAFGIRPINNAVDITNYILALFGQPLHAFDYKLLGNNIVVRNAYDNEHIITLDNIDRTLNSNDIVITDGVKPVCLAGVMGGINSSINDETKDIVLEAAVFDPVSVRKTYTRLDLRSESSIRYEKGIDINRTKLALDYACYLFHELCGATISIGDVSDGITSVNDKVVKVNSKYVSNYLGIDITSSEIVDIMNRLAFNATKDEDDVTVYVPSRRPDISIKQDIIEEIGRIYGYTKLPVTLPKTNLAGGLTFYQQKRRNLKHVLASLGLVEAVNYSLLENNNEFTYLMNKEYNDVVLMHPISNERKVLRRSLIPSILTNVSYSFNRKLENAEFFEIGKVYNNINGEYEEHEHLSIAMSNIFTSTNWKGEKELVDFYTIKGVLEEVFKSLNVTCEYQKLDSEFNEMHPLRTAKILYNNEVIGFVGELHPKYQQSHDLKNVYVAEVNIDKLIKNNDYQVVYTPVSKVPTVERDLALVVSKTVSAGELVKVIMNTDKKLIKNVDIFDLYVGDKIDEDKKSIACKIILSSDETLTDDIVNNKINKVLKNLERELNATLRK